MSVVVDMLHFEEAPSAGDNASTAGELAARPPPTQPPPAELSSAAFQVVYDVDLDKPVLLAQTELFPKFELDQEVELN